MFADGEYRPVAKGDRVRVLFSGKEYVSVVYSVGVVPNVDISKVRPIIAIEDLPAVSESEMALWEFISNYYMCSLGEVYLAAYPVSRVKSELAAERIREREKLRFEKKIETLKTKKGKVWEKYEKKKEKLAQLTQFVDKNKDKIELLNSQLEALSQQIVQIENSLAYLEGGDSHPLKSDGCSDVSMHKEIVLTDAQRVAKDEICKLFENNKIVLLNGITGSGKTELYITIAKEVMARGLNVLFMVPEIAMTYQLECRIRKMVGDVLLTFNSSESFTQRRSTAEKMRVGQYFMLGTRSSIFLPHHNLGLIVVDEEHDASYKQDSMSPRYNGRDCAIMLGDIHKCPVLLGSATPSLESLFNCHNGRYGLVELTERYYENTEPEVEIIDTIAERKKRGMVGSLSRKLISHIHDALESSGQVLLLRGRKSYAPFVQCDNCGSIPRCPHCNVSLSYHKDRNALVCHHCGFNKGFIAECPECGGNRLLMGSGTQKIEEEIADLFKNAKVARMDRDNSSSWVKNIEAFSEGEIDILVGTQLVSKGFDFERISLVAVIQPDGILGLQDFRADERAYQLIRQLAGRGGRRGGKCRLVIQTSQPSHPVYKRLFEQDTFIQEELAVRKQFFYPPYTRMICLVMKDKNQSRLDKMSSLLVSEIAMKFGVRLTATSVQKDSSIQVSYCYSPLIDRLHDQHLKHARISMKRDRHLAENKRKLASIIQEFEKKYSWFGHIVVDVDPIG